MGNNDTRQPNIVPKKKRQIIQKVKTFQGEANFIVPSRSTLVDEQNDTIISQSGAGGVDVMGVNEEFANLINVPTCGGGMPSGPVTPLPPSGPSTPTGSGPTTTSGGGGTSGGTTTTPSGGGGTPTPPPVCGPSTGGGGVTPIGPTTTPPTNTPPPTNGTAPTPTFIFVPSGSGILNSGGGGTQTGTWIPPVCTSEPVATPKTPVSTGGGFGGGGGGGMLPQQEGMGAQPSFFQKNKMLIGGLLILAILGYVITQHNKKA